MGEAREPWQMHVIRGTSIKMQLLQTYTWVGLSPSLRGPVSFGRHERMRLQK